MSATIERTLSNGAGIAITRYAGPRRDLQAPAPMLYEIHLDGSATNRAPDACSGLTESDVNTIRHMCGTICLPGFKGE